MQRSERWLNLLFGGSVLSWAVAGLVAAERLERYSTVRLVITALHLAVGCLLIFRAQVRRSGSVGEVIVSLPGLVVAGWALKAAPAAEAWPSHAQWLFGMGGGLAVVSFLCLGRNFAVLPSLREIVQSGPFSVVRHPAYVGELIMIAACAVARPGLPSILPLLVALPFILIRVLVEERVLRGDNRYLEYSRRVRWRLVPRIW